MQFTGTPQTSNGHYMAEIHEYENALNSLDQVVLTTVDYAAGYSVAVAPDGAIHSYSSSSLVAPISAVNNLSQNVLPLVTSDDGSFYQGFTGDALTVGFGPLSGDKQKIVLGSRDAIIDGCNCYKWGIPIQVQATGGSWQTVTTIYPRVDDRTQIVDLTGLFGATGVVNVRLLLRAEHQIDWIALERNANIAMTITNQSPTQVNYSDGSVAQLSPLLNDDGVYFSVLPGFYIFMTFNIPPQSSPQRSLVLRVNGFYTVQGGGLGPGGGPGSPLP